MLAEELRLPHDYVEAALAVVQDALTTATDKKSYVREVDGQAFYTYEVSGTVLPPPGSSGWLDVRCVRTLTAGAPLAPPKAALVCRTSTTLRPSR